MGAGFGIWKLVVVVAVDERSHENLQDPETILEEATTWLDDLNASVRAVSVRRGGAEEQPKSKTTHG